MEELKPCPFCGKQPFKQTDHPFTRIFCSSQRCKIVVETYGSRKEATAVAAWNDRAVDPLAQELYDALRDAEVILRVLKVSAPCNMSTNDMGKSHNLTHFGTLEAVQKTLKNCEDSR